MADVGTVRNRLEKFLAAADAAKQAETPAPTEDEVEA